MITYKLEILSIQTTDTDSVKDAVTKIQWAYTGVSGDKSYTYPGETRFNVDNLSKKGFIKLPKLTEELVSKWVMDDTSFAKNAIEAEISRQLDNKEQTKPLPWKL